MGPKWKHPPRLSHLHYCLLTFSILPMDNLNNGRLCCWIVLSWPYCDQHSYPVRTFFVHNVFSVSSEKFKLALGQNLASVWSGQNEDIRPCSTQTLTKNLNLKYELRLVASDNLNENYTTIVYMSTMLMTTHLLTILNPS